MPLHAAQRPVINLDALRSERVELERRMERVARELNAWARQSPPEV